MMSTLKVVMSENEMMMLVSISTLMLSVLVPVSLTMTWMLVSILMLSVSMLSALTHENPTTMLVLENVNGLIARQDAVSRAWAGDS